jgi:hypothetical protein
MLSAVVLALAFTGASATGAAAQDAHEVRVGSGVTITTCVARSVDDADEYVLTHLVDMPTHPPIAGKVVYWVEDVDRLKQYEGKRIRFDARIKDVDRKEMEVKPARGVVEIEGPGGEVKARPESVGLTAVASGSSESTIKTTLVELELTGEPSVVTGACTAAVATESETASAATTTHTAASANTTTAATASTATSTTSASTEAATSTAVSSTAAAGTGAPSVASETETTAAAATPVPEPEREAHATGTEAFTERTMLPRTASPLPLVGLLGLGSLIGAAALRRMR